MRKIFNIMLTAALAVFAVSCTVEKDPVYSPDNAVPSVLDPITDYELSDSVEVFAEISFTPADFGMSTAKSYTAYVDLAGNDFASQKSIGTLIGTPDVEKETMTIESADLNQALLDLGCAIETEVNAEIRILAQIMGESSVVSGPELYSNSVSVTVTPYSMEKVYDVVYGPGEHNGWSFTNMLFCYAEDDNTFTGVVDFGEAYSSSSFKLTNGPAWESGEYADPNSDGSTTTTSMDAASMSVVTSGGGNIINYRTFRYYNFTLDKSALTLSMNKGFNSLKVTGDFNGWATDDTNTNEMTQDPATGKFYIDLDIPSDGGFKFILDNAGTWIGTGADEGLVGIGTGDNISVTAGQYRFYLDLNDWDNPTYELSTSDYGLTE